MKKKNLEQYILERFREEQVVHIGELGKAVGQQIKRITWSFNSGHTVEVLCDVHIELNREFLDGLYDDIRVVVETEGFNQKVVESLKPIFDKLVKRIYDTSQGMIERNLGPTFTGLPRIVRGQFFDGEIKKQMIEIKLKLERLKLTQKAQLRKRRWDRCKFAIGVVVAIATITGLLLSNFVTIENCFLRLIEFLS